MDPESVMNGELISVCVVDDSSIAFRRPLGRCKLSLRELMPCSGIPRPDNRQDTS